MISIEAAAADETWRSLALSFRGVHAVSDQHLTWLLLLLLLMLLMVRLLSNVVTFTSQSFTATSISRRCAKGGGVDGPCLPILGLASPFGALLSFTDSDMKINGTR